MANTEACDICSINQDAGGGTLQRGNRWYVYIEPVCHGCDGKGWVSPTYGVAAICPVCKGAGKLPPTTWHTTPAEWATNTFQPYSRRDYEEILC
jgi:DnaJ-class molecular chaperone